MLNHTNSKNMKLQRGEFQLTVAKKKNTFLIISLHLLSITIRQALC